MTPALLTPEVKARLAEIKGGRIGQLTREPLLVLAEALGVSFEATGKNKTNVPELKKRITEALLNNPSLAMAEDFQKFVFTLVVPAQVQAHKKLLENVSNTAPPPQYRPLAVGTKAEEDDANSDESRSMSSLVNPFDNIGGEDFGGQAIDDILGKDVEGGNGDDGHTGDPATPISDEKGVAQAAKTRLEIDDIPIVVQFQGPERREVWIPSILPEDSKARLTIIGPLGARLKLGTVDQFDGENVPEALELNTVNQYKLKPIEGALTGRFAAGIRRFDGHLMAAALKETAQCVAFEECRTADSVQSRGDKEREDRREAQQEDRKRKRKEEKSAGKKEKKRHRASFEKPLPPTQGIVVCPRWRERFQWHSISVDMTGLHPNALERFKWSEWQQQRRWVARALVAAVVDGKKGDVDSQRGNHILLSSSSLSWSSPRLTIPLGLKTLDFNQENTFKSSWQPQVNIQGVS
ncbi:hypothetical protein B0H16DRAFT_1471512 [Mycena metata]|uniref:Uncharacterized protein n=1 Tax=Mycena metata TaxID=1033252 RepID=A0AAD7HS43_9AGAR|nr:hypothetical protein B0H16DRAFT_1471512 [Mycena metata]